MMNDPPVMRVKAWICGFCGKEPPERHMITGESGALICHACIRTAAVSVRDFDQAKARDAGMKTAELDEWLENPGTR